MKDKFPLAAPKRTRKTASGRKSISLRRNVDGGKKSYSPPAEDMQTIEELEASIPRLAALATRRANRQALAEGRSVLIVEDGKLKRVSPKGQKRTLTQVEPSLKMQKGQIIKIK